MNSPFLFSPYKSDINDASEISEYKYKTINKKNRIFLNTCVY